MATKKELKNVGYYDSQGNYRSFVNNYGNSSSGYYDSQGNWRGIITTPPSVSTGKSEGQTTTNQNRYNEILNQRNEMLKNIGYSDSNNYTTVGNNVYVGNPTYQQPDAIRDYGWGDGSQYLTPDNPLVRPVVYNNEFSPESTMSIANDVYNEYYAPIVEEQQKQTTQAYRNTAQESAAVAGAAGMATGSRGAVQLANQANREATAANLQYQQQMQLQAFQDTLDARNLELQNKIQDYQNAWQEVSQYGYVVTENTGNLLGIQPGQQLTTYAYKQAMSNIAKNVADINAQKVQLNQQQQQLDQSWIQFQESIRQYEKDFTEGQRQFDLNYELNKKSTEAQYDSTIYTRLVDMLGRYDRITPEMANLGAQVGMYLPIGGVSSDYFTEAERAAANEASATNQAYLSSAQLQELAQEYMPTVQSSGKIGNASQFSSILAQWQAEGVSALAAINKINDMKNQTIKVNGVDYNLGDAIGNVSGAKDEAKRLASSILGGGTSAYSYSKAMNGINTGKTAGFVGSLAGLGLTGLGIATFNPALTALGVSGTAASIGGMASLDSKEDRINRQYGYN